MASVAAWWHEQVFAGKPPSVALARDFACQHLIAHHQSHLVDDVRLVVSELATNAVVHAQRPFGVCLSRVLGSVLLAIRDGSNWPPVPSVPDVMDMSGRGLMLVELLSQEWGTRTDDHGFKSVWASFPGTVR